MNKKMSFIILILFFIFCSLAFSQQTMLFRAEVSFEEIAHNTPVVITIFHSDIDRVSVNMRTLVATGTVVLAQDSVGLSNNQGDGIIIQYYTDDNSIVKASSVTYKKTDEHLYSFVTSPIVIDTNSEYIYYRISAKASDGTMGSYPSSNSYIEANVKQIETQAIGTSGGILTLQSGDQTRGNTVQYFLQGALLSTTNYRIKELYTSETLPFIGGLRPIIAYEFTPADIIVNSQALMPSITLYYGDLVSDYNNIEVRWLNGTRWENVSFTNNFEMRTVTVNLALTNTKLGYYAVFDKVALSDSDYRPVYKVFRLGEELEFRNLGTGDTVTIFDINGREIARLTSKPFKWNGRKSSG
ncbi:MAG: hypothetical protein LBD46_08855, partial [Endomicrobium sp.]|nr:hypothetical protein [Endomicrobium sp.]